MRPPNFINSTKNNINNDTAIEISQDKKYYYYGNNNFYNKQVGVGDEFGPKTFTGKFSLSNKEQFRVKKYNYEYHKNPKNEDGEKKRFFNSKMDNSKENLKDLDSKGDLFLEKYKKAISNEHMAFGFSSSENSTQNTPQVKNNNDVEKKETLNQKKINDSGKTQPTKRYHIIQKSEELEILKKKLTKK
jgi:hypothetical protein